MSDETIRKQHKRPTGMALVKKVILVFTLWALFGLGVRLAVNVLAAEPATPAFNQTWQRTDLPVSSGQVDRTWMWGEAANTSALTEPYTESPGGQRTVQYFDKSRMEDNTFRASAPWDVTNGLLVVELVTGRMQVGDNDFVQHAPATVNVAGDADDDRGPQYATLAGLLAAPALPDGATITQRLDRDGNVTDDLALAGFGVTAAHRVSVPGIEHQVASPFWAFMNSTGTVYEGGSYLTAPMFLSPFYATGYPITEAYWANVKVAGTYQDVLLQCFERRCLTFTPGNSEGWQVEAGNVGQHYYTWRYQQAGEDPGTQPPAGTPPAAPTGTATVTATDPADGTPPAGPTASPTASPTATDPAEPTASPTPTHEPYFYAFEWGEPVEEDTELTSPIDVAASSLGRIYVIEQNLHRVLMFDRHGAYTGWFGGYGSGEGKFYYPSGITTGPDGRVYVADGSNCLVQIFDRDGNFLSQFGARGENPGQFSNPSDVALDSQGFVYVVDSGNQRVQKFDAEWNPVGEWGAPVDPLNPGTGEFLQPGSIAINANDEIFVTDLGKSVVQVFDSGGAYLREWGQFGDGIGEFALPSGIAIDAAGIVYVADSANDRIQAFDGYGFRKGGWGAEGSEPGQFDNPNGIAVFDGTVFVTDYLNERIQSFDGRGNFLEEWSDGRRGRFGSLTFGMAIDARGRVYLADTNFSRIQIFDADGRFLDEFGEPGTGPGQLNAPASLAIAPDGYLYALDTEFNRVLKFQTSGGYVSEWAISGGQYAAIAADIAGNIYVTDLVQDSVLKFDSTGALIDAWGETGNGAGEFNDPAGIAIYKDRVYVLDYGNDRVQVFDRGGVHLGGWGEAGDGNGEFNQPMGISVDRFGFVYVADTGNHRVQKFTPEGVYLTKLGSEGSGNGQFSNPTRVEINPDGIVYVLDNGNYRVQVFDQPSNRFVP